MSHRHFCDYADHYWQCDGTALRLVDTEPSLCMCRYHGIPIEEGDHSRCMIELLACPEHREAQLRQIGYKPSTDNMPSCEADAEAEASTFQGKDGRRTVGFCLWCSRHFYSMEELKAHNADDMKACPAFQELKGEQSMPPVLQASVEKFGLLDNILPEAPKKPKLLN